jgi:4-hydroxybenzoate polyprenyltransferase
MAGCRLLVFLLTGLAVSGALAKMVVAAGVLQFVYVVLLSMVARHENQRAQPFRVPVIPLMIAGISLLDGLIMAVGVHPLWLFAGIAGAVLTLQGQKYFRGD